MPVTPTNHSYPDHENVVCIFSIFLDRNFKYLLNLCLLITVPSLFTWLFSRLLLLVCCLRGCSADFCCYSVVYVVVQPISVATLFMWLLS
jgi:hypothetical protein